MPAILDTAPPSSLDLDRNMSQCIEVATAAMLSVAS